MYYNKLFLFFNIFFFLHIMCVLGYESTAPVATIMGPREQRVPSGSTITLRCVITSPYQPRPIRGAQWLRDNKLLTFQVIKTNDDDRKKKKKYA